MKCICLSLPVVCVSTHALCYLIALSISPPSTHFRCFLLSPPLALSPYPPSLTISSMTSFADNLLVPFLHPLLLHSSPSSPPSITVSSSTSIPHHRLLLLLHLHPSPSPPPPPPPPVVNCTEPGKVDNSDRQVVTSGPHRYSFQTAVSYRCNPGYYLLGTSSISCQGGGTWDRSLPKCLRECPDCFYLLHFGGQCPSEKLSTRLRLTRASREMGEEDCWKK